MRRLSRRRGATLGALLLGVAAASLFLRMPSRAQTPPSNSLPPSVVARVQGCPICRKMAESLPPAEFSRDPHTFACAVCHHPHTQKTTEEWRATCTSSGCHPRAWTRTVYHRLDINVFVNCTNCHGVHSSSLKGTTCRDCHAAFLDSSRVLTVTQVPGVSRFNHAPHRGLACASCHRSDRKHAEMALSSAADCSTCHHEARRGTPCTTCHAGNSIAFTRSLPVQMTLSVWDAPRSREILFPHARHSALPCASCHQKGGEAAQADCATCHDVHHRPEADCAHCHAAPPADAHDVDVHEAECTDCHAKGPGRAKPDTRSFCLSCHPAQADHNPGKVCITCHKLTAGP